MTGRAQLAAALTLALALGGGCGGASQEGAGAETPEADPLDSISGEELYRRGMLLGRAGDFVRAEQYLSASIERGFPEERALPALLDVCIQASRLVAALEYAEPYLSQHPSQWPLRLLVASIRMGLGETERAREELERVLRDAGDDEPPAAHYFLGVLFRDSLDDAEASAAHFRRYLELEPEGMHRDEAEAALRPGGGGPPRRIEADEVPPAPGEGTDDAASPEGEVPATSGGDESEVSP